jgi:archaeosine synthase
MRDLEVYLIKRDGWARITELRIEGRVIRTPSVISVKDPLLSEMNFDFVPYSLKIFDRKRFEEFHSDDHSIIIASGLAPLSTTELLKCLIELRRESVTKPLFLAGIATPQNLPLLCYFGADIFDDSMAIISAHEGYYLLEHGNFKLEGLREFPCSCPACEKMRRLPELDAAEKTAFLKEHNVRKLQEQASLTRELIRSETLRNFVEARAKTSPELTLMLRKEGRFYERVHPRFKRSIVYMNTVESFKRPEVTIFLERVREAYYPQTKTALLLPCTARKPYSLSKTHKRITSAAGNLLNFFDEIIISSPLVCPREFELTYPAQNYDTPVTGVWSEEEIEFVSDKLNSLLAGFKMVIAHVEGGYRRVVERAAEKRDFEVIFTAEKDITSEISLRNLRSVLEDAKERRKDRLMAIFEAMFRYQFGIELKDYVPSGKIKGRYPNLELIAEERVLRIDNSYGMLDVYLPLARELLKEGRYSVEIDEFDPKGAIFAGGVLRADERIRPNDIVFFKNSALYGVGRALMTGEEMVEAEKGFAIEVKRKESL